MALAVGAALVTPTAASAQGNLYATNYASGGTVSQFSIAAGGALVQQGTGVVSGSSSSSRPGAAVISPDGRYLYVTNFGLGTVSEFSIGSGGALTQVGTGVTSGSGAGSQPFGLAASPGGQYVFVANQGQGTVSTFAVGAGGALVQQGTGVATASGAGSQPTAVAVSPSGQSLYAVNMGSAMGTVSTFHVGAGGALTLQGAPVTAGRSTASQPVAVAVAPDGQHLYVANAAEGTVSTFQIGATGAISQQGAPVSAGSGSTSDPHGLAVSPNGQYVFVANAGQGTVSTFQVGATGGLTQLGAPVRSGSGAGAFPAAMAVSPSGQYLYVANYADGTVSTFTVGAGGVLTAQGTPVTSGAGATSGPYGLIASPDQGPTASFTSSVGPAGFPTTVDAQASTAGSAPIATYAWQFGDGGTATGVRASHTYARAGTYRVTLTATGSDLCSVAGPFTGQSASCASDPGASIVRTITVPAAPSVTHASIKGIAKRKPVLSFTVAAGRGAAPLRAIAISLPTGLHFTRATAIRLAGGRALRFTHTLRRGTLTITPARAVATVRVSVASPELAASPSLVKKVAKHRRGVRLIVRLQVTDSKPMIFTLATKLLAR